MGAADRICAVLGWFHSRRGSAVADPSARALVASLGGQGRRRFWRQHAPELVAGAEQLRIAQEMFGAMGAAAFADRAERELLATGERARKRNVETRDELTAQEAQIARLARDGVPNAEIGARLFISRRTVEYHLSKVFTKLDITTRVQLARGLPGDPNLGEGNGQHLTTSR